MIWIIVGICAGIVVHRHIRRYAMRKELRRRIMAEHARQRDDVRSWLYCDDRNRVLRGIEESGERLHELMKQAERLGDEYAMSAIRRVECDVVPCHYVRPHEDVEAALDAMTRALGLPERPEGKRIETPDGIRLRLCPSRVDCWDCRHRKACLFSAYFKEDNA